MGAEVEAEPRTGRRRRVANDRIPVWFGIPFFLIGSLTLLLGVNLLDDELRFGEEGVAAQGAVIDLWISSGSDSTAYMVAYRFADPGSGMSKSGSSSVDWRTYQALEVGDGVVVTYLPSYPTKHRLGTPELQLGPPLVVLGVGSLFALVGPALLVMAVRQRRAGSPSGTPKTSTAPIPGPPREVSEAELRRVEIFRQSGSQAAFGGFAAGCGGIAFLGLAGLFLFGVIASPIEMRLFGALGFGFFGLLLAAGAIASAWRGGDTRVAEIGPDGAWLPGMGQLPWADIEEVRLEAIRTVGGGDLPVTAQYRRLGFVPRDPTIKPDRFANLAWALARGYLGFVRRLEPGLRHGVGADDTAPFGVTETEIPRDFERLVETIRRHVPVVDAVEARARRRAWRWHAKAPGGEPSPDVVALDSSLAPQVQAVGAAPSRRSLVEIVPSASPQPRATFGLAPVRLVHGLVAMLPIAVLFGISISLAAPWALRDRASVVVSAVIFGFFVLAFVVPSALQLVGLVRRARDRKSDPVRLRVGPDGVWTRDVGDVGWSDVAEIRTERAGRAGRVGMPIERWRLVITTKAGRSSRVASDELDAPFDDVLDLIRFYHPVIESS